MYGSREKGSGGLMVVRWRFAAAGVAGFNPKPSLDNKNAMLGLRNAFRR
ncbi:hypothetical protein HanIR_Chr16g0808841 [Helianthus annuus]|nr:hypothetical protein HanIR_Chr16g0808841 [Helianthus annuus]